MISFLGRFLHLTACAASLLWIGFTLFVGAKAPHPDWTLVVPVAIIGALALVRRAALTCWRVVDL